VTPRHFILTPVGSSGDVHPYVGIGRALRARGHDVTLITAEPFRQVGERAGLTFVATHTAAEFEELSKHPDLWHPQRGLRLILRSAARALRVEYARIAEAYRPGESVLVGHTLAFAARLVEETHRAPAATLQLAPSIFRTLHRQPVHFPGHDTTRYPQWAKRAMWWFVDRAAIDPLIVPALNRFRRELGLPSMSRIFNVWVHSPQRVVGLFPEWFAPPQPDWPPQLRLTGFPLYDESDQHTLPRDLEAFLAGGSPPIVFTPGSANQAASVFLRTAVEAAAGLQQRALLLTRYSEQVPHPLPPAVRHEAYVPFSQVLPRCGALVHHGGIGTCAQGIAAGIPQLVMPLGFDQPDNATRLERLGVGSWLRRSRFTPARVADALESLLQSASIQSRCRRWADAVRAVDTISDTCDLLEVL
jgi:UDP:flavonoid glycosyltransferase YjiC (YdhE family)